MPRKTAAEKAAELAAEEAAAAEAARHEIEKRRMKWAGLFLAAVAVFAGGYAIGHSDDSLVAANRTGAEVVPGSQTQVPGPGIGRGNGAGPGQNQGDLPGRGGIDRFPGHGPGQFPGDCPFGIYPPDDESDDQVVPGDAQTVAPGFLGVGVVQAPQGVVVTEVVEGSPAESAGIEVDDVIVRFQDTPVVTVGQFSMLVKSSGDGSTVTITVSRGGGDVTLNALLGASPE